MNIAWSREAIDNLARLRSYISENDSSVAQRVALYILHQVEAVLPDNPEFGRTGRVAGTRELVIPKTPFIVPYRVNEQSLENLRIYRVAHVGRKFFESIKWRDGYGDDPYRQSNSTRAIFIVVRYGRNGLNLGIAIRSPARILCGRALIVYVNDPRSSNRFSLTGDASGTDTSDGATRRFRYCDRLPARGGRGRN